VAGKLVASGLDLTNQMRKALCNPPNNKESALGVVIVKKVQHALRVYYHSRRPLVPAIAVDNACECFDLEIVFHINTQNVCFACRFEILVPQKSLFF
jgi:hypothetical protein